MNIPRKRALYLSILVIIVYWAYQLYGAGGKAPSEFSVLMLSIATKKTIHLVSIILLLWFSGESWSQLGFTSNKLGKQLLTGAALGTIMFLLFNVLLSSLLDSLFPRAPGVSVLSYFTDINNLYIWLLVGIFGGGFVEELVRMFILTRFENTFGKVGLYGALVVSSVIFGVGHLYQGTGTAIGTAFSGLTLGLIYIKRRSAFELITIHAISDILAILAAYGLAGH